MLKKQNKSTMTLIRKSCNILRERSGGLPLEATKYNQPSNRGKERNEALS